MITDLRLFLLSAVAATMWTGEGEPLPSDHYDLAGLTAEDVEVCVPYIEDQPVGYTFRRIARFFRDGDALYTIKGLEDMNIFEALHCYSYGK